MSIKPIKVAVTLTLFAMGTFGAFGATGDGKFYNPNEEYHKGIAALRANNFNAAVTAFDNVISVVPKDSNTWTLMGLSKSGAGDQRGAGAAFEKAVRFNRDNVIAHGELGAIEAKSGENARAQKELEWLQSKDADCSGNCKGAHDLSTRLPRCRPLFDGHIAHRPRRFTGSDV